MLPERVESFLVDYRFRSWSFSVGYFRLAETGLVRCSTQLGAAVGPAAGSVVGSTQLDTVAGPAAGLKAGSTQLDTAAGPAALQLALLLLPDRCPFCHSQSLVLLFLPA